MFAGRERPGVFEEVARHPVVLAGAGHVAHLLAEDVPVELGAALAGGADIGNRQRGS